MISASRKRLSAGSIIIIVVVATIIAYIVIWAAIVFPRMERYRSREVGGAYRVTTTYPLPDPTDFRSQYIGYVLLQSADYKNSLHFNVNLISGEITELTISVETARSIVGGIERSETALFTVDDNGRVFQTETYDGEHDTTQAVSQSQLATAQSLFDEAQSRWSIGDNLTPQGDL